MQRGLECPGIEGEELSSAGEREEGPGGLDELGERRRLVQLEGQRRRLRPHDEMWPVTERDDRLPTRDHHSRM